MKKQPGEPLKGREFPPLKEDHDLDDREVKIRNWLQERFGTLEKVARVFGIDLKSSVDPKQPQE